MKMVTALICLFYSTATFAQSNHHDSGHQSSSHHEESKSDTHSTPHWGYAGKEGPENWAKLSSDYTTCEEGKNQSPIDLKWKHRKGTREIVFHYKPSELEVVDNGHTIQANVPSGSYATIDGKNYQLVQFHFHSLSEHSFSGKYYPLEVHFVHKDDKGSLAVIGAVFQEGKKNMNLANVFSSIPTPEAHQASKTKRFNPRELLPSIMTHYHYVGSLTTPPCSEGVNWNVLNTPVDASYEQIERFRTIYSQNNRPIQPVYDRKPANF
ncbi:MAG: carbonic anhydrase family protein [Oligoflexia bacterium]|nr:carbonic anhydrase family protein [Oligoflexia bacterium]